MAAGGPSAAASGDVSPVTSFSLPPIPSAARLREALTALSQVMDQLATRQPPLEIHVPPNPPKPSLPPAQAFDSSDNTASDDATTTVSDILDAAVATVAEAADGGDGDEAPGSDAVCRTADEILREVYAFLSCPSSNQVGPLRFVGRFCSDVSCSEFWLGVSLMVYWFVIPLRYCDRWPLTHSRWCSRNLLPALVLWA